MRIKTLFLAICIAFTFTAGAIPPGDSTEIINIEAYQKFADSVNNALEYKTGKIDLQGGHVSLNIPAEFKYLGAEQSKYVITELWGNPETSAEGLLGMLFPQNAGPLDDSSYAFVISYEDAGYVKDDDADKIDYDELLSNIKKEQKTENVERLKSGYPSIHIIGWAQKPFYDDKRKILHWAKELQFGDDDSVGHTLNYDVRILGRKGILSMNAIGSIEQLPVVNRDIPKILGIATFTEGNAYSDFNPDADKIAAWTIGGLVAGKILAKAGLFAVIVKFMAPLWKFIIALVLPIGVWVKRRFSRKQTEQYSPVPTQPEDPSGSDTTA